MKIVINRCYGGFSVSELAKNLYQLMTGEELVDYDVKRTDPVLVTIVETIGDRADGICASLAVIEIPDDVDYTIDDYDGVESIHEVHRVWS